jgi:hypothetical protein
LPIFGGKKLAFFSKTNVMIDFFQKQAVIWAKNANIFAKLFGENILKIITSVPGRIFLDAAFFQLFLRVRRQIRAGRFQASARTEVAPLPRPRLSAGQGAQRLARALRGAAARKIFRVFCRQNESDRRHLDALGIDTGGRSCEAIATCDGSGANVTYDDAYDFLSKISRNFSE